MRRAGIFRSFLMLLLAVSPLLAQDNSFKIYGGLAYVSPLSDENVDIDGVVDSLQASSEAGWNLGVEFRFNKLLGLELDGVHATQDIEFGGNTIADVDFTPLSATLDFHLIHTKVIDLYLGPTASYIIWGDINVKDANFGDDNGADNQFAWGALVGLDIGFGKTFAITLGVRWLDVDLEPNGSSDSVGVDPLISRLGVAFRF